jgi:hypothetical protein
LHNRKRGRDMKIAVVGATGATGRRVVKHALAQGHFVTAVARHPERLSSADRLSFVRGDVLSPGGLSGALDGVEAVISCIGPEKNLSPGTLMSVGVASILTECKRANVRRFTMQSGRRADDGHHTRTLPGRYRFATQLAGGEDCRSNQQHAFAAFVLRGTLRARSFGFPSSACTLQQISRERCALLWSLPR